MTVADTVFPAESAAVTVTGPVQAEASTRCAVTVTPSDKSVTVTRAGLLDETLKGLKSPVSLKVTSVAAPNEAEEGLMASVVGSLDVIE